MDKNKLLSMIGLCKKANRLLQGYEVVMESVGQGTTKLVLTAEDLSPRSLRKLTNAIEGTETVCAIIPITMNVLEERIGKRVGILGIADEGFAKAMKEIINI